MKFRMFTVNGNKIALNIDSIEGISCNEKKGNTIIKIIGDYPFDLPSYGEIEVDEDFDTVFSRLNTIAE